MVMSSWETLTIYVSEDPRRGWELPYRVIVKSYAHREHRGEFASAEDIPLPESVRDRMNQLHLMLGSVDDVLVDSDCLYSGGSVPPEIWCELRRWPRDINYGGMNYEGELNYFFALTQTEYDQLVAALGGEKQ